jgi:stage V sporulation protein B
VLDRGGRDGHERAVSEAAEALKATEPSRTTETARRAGRGVLLISGSKIYFLIAGYAGQLFLPRLFASPEVFGLFSAAMSSVSILNNIIVGATVQVVSKRVSEAVDRSEITLRQALSVQLWLGLGLAAALFTSAPWLAHNLLRDPLLTPLFQLAAAVVLGYSLYTAFVGTLNGRQDFRTQAGFDIGYTTLRTGSMLSAAALGYGAVGAFTGFATASWLIVIASAVVLGLGKREGAVPYRAWISFMAPLWLYQSCVQVIMQADLALLKRSVAVILQADGASITAAAETASRYVAFYRAAQTFAFVPYQLLLPVPLVMFPMISQAISQNDEAGAARYVRTAMRFSLLLLLLVAAPVAGAARGVMGLVFPAAYTDGAPALAVLVFAMVGFALFVGAATIMTGAGRPGLAASIGSVAVVFLISGNLGFVHYVGVGDNTLLAAALGTSLGIAVALSAMAFAVYKRFHTFIAPLSIARALAATLAAYFVANAIGHSGKLQTLIAGILGALSYVVTLLVTRELTREDLNALLSIARRKRK